MSEVADLEREIEQILADWKSEQAQDLAVMARDAACIERLRGLLTDALDGWANQGDYGEDPYDTIARIRREAGLA